MRRLAIGGRKLCSRSRGQRAIREIKAEPVGAPGGVCVSIANPRQTGAVERLRGRPVIVKRDRRWRYRGPGAGVRGERTTALPRQLGRRHGRTESRAPRKRPAGKSRRDIARQAAQGYWATADK